MWETGVGIKCQSSVSKLSVEVECQSRDSELSIGIDVRSPHSAWIFEIKNEPGRLKAIFEIDTRSRHSD